jgi:hypothetical protein
LKKKNPCNTSTANELVASVLSEATFKLELMNRPATAIENFSSILRNYDPSIANSFGGNNGMLRLDRQFGWSISPKPKYLMLQQMHFSFILLWYVSCASDISLTKSVK